MFLKLAGQGTILMEIGPGGLLHSLFSTIAVRLEMGQWGSRFPTVMGAFYQGESLDPGAASHALDEWRRIECGLAEQPPSAIVWDIEQPGAKPPWGAAYGAHVTSVANYYFTKYGLNLVAEVREHLECVVQSGGTLQLVTAPGHAYVA